jgi:UDP-N-acetylmuramoyl-L-alanyl-D-glutamate--2,6-diaminopimelate ligase
MSIRKAVKKAIPSGFFATIEPYGHLVEAVGRTAADGFPARGLKVIGITGTNGKTTTCFLVHRMLHEAGYKVALMTTVAYGVGDDIKPQLTHMTTPTVPVLHKRLKDFKEQGVEWVVLETTSHALAQHRVWGVPYTVAVMTNITHEHLTYHRTFARYLEAKRQLFVLTNRNKKGLRVGIANADDPNVTTFTSAIAHPVTYGIDGGDVQAKNVVLAGNGVSYTATVGGTAEIYDIKCQIPGSFNVSNSLAALCVGRALGLTKSQIEQGIAALKGVEGRMTHINEGQDFDVLVDYAHTPDSFEKLFRDIRPVVKGKLIVLFGSLGGGDKAKRPLQGELAGKYADEVIICEEDDRSEDPDTIATDITIGVEKSGKLRDKDLFVIHERPEAIQFAINRAKKGDMVLLLGKGHEKTIEHADGEHPWDEIGTAHAALKNRTR